MLDECKGERFEEVIANFAMNTIHKVVSLPEGLQGRVISEAHVLPLVLATRVSLQIKLEARREEDAKIRQDLKSLASASTTIQQRLEAAKSISVRLDEAMQRQLQALIDSNWIGSALWSDILLHGIPITGVLEEEQDSPKQPDERNEPRKLIRDLDTRIQKHQTRLAEWRIIAKDLAAQQKLSADQIALPQLNNTVEISPFVQHKDLNFPSRKAEIDIGLHMDKSYADLLTSMRQDLSTNSTTIKEESQHRDALHLSVDSNTDRHFVAKPVRTSTDSDQQQSVSERPNSADCSFMSNVDDENILPEEEQRSISPSPPQSSIGDSPWVASMEPSVTTTGDSHITPVKIPTPPNPIMPEPAISPSKLWMSLADRTRASMSLTGRTSTLTDPDSPVNIGTQPPKDPSSQDWHQLSDDDHHASLVERTRKSMSMFSNSSAIRQRKVNSVKRSSQVYPVNQFETPGRAQASVEQTPGSGASTPRDQLFEEEAEYNSIFKSRPKIALSPAFGSEQATSGLGSILEQDVDQLNLNSDDNVD